MIANVENRREIKLASSFLILLSFTLQKKSNSIYSMSINDIESGDSSCLNIFLLYQIFFFFFFSWQKKKKKKIEKKKFKKGFKCLVFLKFAIYFFYNSK
jgi:hypothetical protein